MFPEGHVCVSSHTTSAHTRGCEHSFDALIVHDASMKLEMLQEAVEDLETQKQRERWHVLRMYDTLPRLHPLSAQLCTQETWSTNKQ